MRSLMLVLLVAAVGCQAASLGKIDFTKAKAVAISALSVVAITSATADEEEDASDACRNCNGTGKIGDGRIVKTCPICNGTGKKTDSSVAISEAPEPEVPKEVKHEEVVQAPEPKPQEPPAKVVGPVEIQRKLTVYTLPRCERCKEWLQREQKTWEAMGFEIVVEQDTQGLEVPWFLIEDEEIKKNAGYPLTWTIYSDWRAAYRAKSRN